MMLADDLGPKMVKRAAGDKETPAVPRTNQRAYKVVPSNSGVLGIDRLTEAKPRPEPASEVVTVRRRKDAVAGISAGVPGSALSITSTASTPGATLDSPMV